MPEMIVPAPAASAAVDRLALVTDSPRASAAPMASCVCCPPAPGFCVAED